MPKLTDAEVDWLHIEVALEKAQTIAGDAIPNPGPHRLSVQHARRLREARCRFQAPPDDYFVSTVVPPRFGGSYEMPVPCL